MNNFMKRPEKGKTRFEKELWGDMLATNSKDKMQLLTNLESTRDDKILERDEDGDIVNSLGDTSGSALVHSFGKDNPHGIVSPIDKQEQEYQQTKLLMRKSADGVPPRMTQDRATRTIDDLEKGNERKGVVKNPTYKFKVSKLRLKLAALGMNNMTYQKSKPVKIIKKKHPEVRKAGAEAMEDILRKTGTSKDGTHAHSSWMTKTGEFVGGGEAHINQVMDADPEFHKAQGNVESDDIVTNFAKKHELIRVQSFPTNRAGESRTSFGIHHKPSSGQLRSMKSLEDSGEVIGHATGPDHRAATTGEGFKSIRQSIGKHFP